MNENNALARPQEKIASIRALVEKSKAQIALALPKHLNVDRLARIVMTSVQKTPRLLMCSQTSLIGAVIQAAQLGLEPDGVLGEAFLIPYKNRRSGNFECQFQPGYKGLIKLARQSGEISTIAARIVRQGDLFRYRLGLEEQLDHEPKAPHSAEPTHCYAIAKLKDGGKQFEVMTTEEIEELRQRCSKSSDDGPWVTDWEAMAKKTVLKRLCKLLPASVELAKAVAYDDLSTAGLPQEFEDAIDLPEATVPSLPASKLDALAEQSTPEREPGQDEPPPEEEKPRTVHARRDARPYIAKR